MTLSFFAHSTLSQDRHDWEPLEWHLYRVAVLARRFAARFGAPKWSAAAGLLHDVGKYLEEFQRRLDGDPTRVDHAIGGAKAAIDLFGHPGLLIAYGVAGHHAGLPDGRGPGDDALASRLKKKEAALPEVWRQRIRFPALDDLINEAEAVLGSGADVFAVAFFARMLFSCLVDADFLATEWFLDKQRKRLRRAKLPAAADLAPVLCAWLDNEFRAPNTAIEQHRADILSACRRMAAEKPGIFSLSVPTGGGKTFSSLAFALEHAKANDLDRVIYAVPYTAIIEQTADDFRAALKAAGEHVVLEHHSAAEPLPADENELIGPRRLHLATENWDAPLVVTTTVQLFESLYAARPSRCRKLHNLARSVIILDEVQALPLPRLSACLAALKELSERYRTSILLCSATIPAFDGNTALPVTLPKVRPIVVETVARARAFRRVRIEDAGRLDDAQLVSRLGEIEQVLCVVDTRRHAAAIYDLLPEQGRFHLSAAMCPAHRRQVLEKVKCRLQQGELCRLVANAVIQAGVNISFPDVWRAMAGIDSLAQAAGRGNRHGEIKDGLGRFVIFESTRPDALPKNMVDLLRRRQIARLILEDGSDPLAPETVARFFERLLQNSELDANACWKRISNAELEGIPFRSVAADFKMIDDQTSPLFIEWDDTARELVTKLRGLLASEVPDPHPLRDILCRLQVYAVGVYGLEQLKRQGDIEVLDAEGQFHVLLNRNLYDSATGFRPERGGLLDPEKMVV